jgi:hypothetical protein
MGSQCRISLYKLINAVITEAFRLDNFASHHSDYSIAGGAPLRL